MYTVNILSNDAFDKLPEEVTKGSDTQELMGFADPETNQAYVRYFGVPALNKYLVDHEFDHLLEEEGTDVAPNGLRYKTFGSAAANIGSALGGAARGVGSAVTGGASLLGRGASALGRGAASLGRGALDLFGGGAAQAATPSRGGGMLVQGPQNPQGFISNFLPGFQGPQQSGGLTPQPLFRGGLQLPQQQNIPFQPDPQPASKDDDFDILKFFGDNQQNIAGLGSLAAGLFKGFPEVPQFPTGDLQAQIAAGGGPLGAAGQEALQTQLNQQFEPLSEPEIQAALRQIERDEERALDQVRDLYRNLRPGSDEFTDTAFRRDMQETRDNFARAKADILANRTRDIKTQFDNRRLAEIQTALGASGQEISQLTQLAQLDIAQIMAQLDLDAEQAALFKNTFLDLGFSLLGSGADQAPSTIVNVGV